MDPVIAILAFSLGVVVNSVLASILMRTRHKTLQEDQSEIIVKKKDGSQERIIVPHDKVESIINNLKTAIEMNAL